MKKHVWRGGPRSHQSYSLDYHRQSSEPWERKTKGRHGVANVSPHFRKTKRGATKVKFHRRRIR